jgi:hypothetical protein
MHLLAERLVFGVDDRVCLLKEDEVKTYLMNRSKVSHLPKFLGIANVSCKWLSPMKLLIKS